MSKVTKAGTIVVPPVLSFYSKPKSVDDLINFVLGKVLDVLGVENELYERWG